MDFAELRIGIEKEFGNLERQRDALRLELAKVETRLVQLQGQHELLAKMEQEGKNESV